MMTFSKQFLLYLIFTISIFSPSLNASNPKSCNISTCGHGNVEVRFPFWILPNQSESCGHVGFNLLCSDGQGTFLKLPNSEPFLVREIDYAKQRIRLNDPKNCMARRLLNFDVSGSPFSLLDPSNYTFFKCPNSLINSSSLKAIHCLGNSTSSSFIVMQTWVASLGVFPCETVKSLLLPISWGLAYSARPGNYSGQDLWLKWNWPDCRDCERKTNSRCGFIDNSTLRVKCISSGHDDESLQVFMIICLFLVGPLIALTLWFCNGMFRSESSSLQIQAVDVTPQPNTTLVVTSTGLDESTIESYKKVDLGESRRLPTGADDTLCSICLSEYKSKESVRCLPECEHCFHTECIDAWLKLHSSCPVCRSNPSPAR